MMNFAFKMMDFVFKMMDFAANAATSGGSALTAEEQTILERAAELATLLQNSATGGGSVMHNARQVVDGGDIPEDAGPVVGGGALSMRQSSASSGGQAFAEDSMVQFVCPDGTGPGAQIQVQDPSTGEMVVVTLPAGATPGQPVQVRVGAPAAGAAGGGAAAITIDSVPTLPGQAFNAMSKSFSLQKSQKKANCCYCCVFILMLIVNLAAGFVDSLANSLTAAVVYCPVGDYQSVLINDVSTCDLPQLASYMALSSTKAEHMYRFNPSWSYLSDSVGEAASGKSKDSEKTLRIWTAGDAGAGLSIDDDDCFTPTTPSLTRDRCCDLKMSDIGDASCWQPPWFTYDRCCALMEVTASAPLNSRIMASQDFIRDNRKDIEDSICGRDVSDPNLGYLLENRTEAIEKRHQLFPSFGIEYDGFEASATDVSLHYMVEFFQEYRYGGGDQGQFFRIYTSLEEQPDDGESDYGGWGGGRNGRRLQGGPPSGGPPGGAPGRGSRGGGRRGRYSQCDRLENDVAALDYNDLFMLENTMTNAVLKAQHKDTIITTSFVAMPQLAYADNTGVSKLNIQILLYPLTTMILLPSIAQLYTMEREDGLLHAMELASMQVMSYWVGMYAFTVIYTFSYSLLYILSGYAFGLNAFTYPPMVLYLLLALVWAHAQAGIAMFCSAVFSKARMATIVTVLVVLLTSIAGYTITNALDVFPAWLYVFLPFAYTSACSSLMVYNGGLEFYKALFALFFGGSVLIAVVIVDYHYNLKDLAIQKIEEKIREARTGKPADNALEGGRGGDPAALALTSFSTTAAAQEDADVAEERKRIAGLSDGSEAIVVKNLVKEFDMGVALPKKVAVRDLCLTVKKGEVFGLLGQNGAGKTTTINLLTGLHSISGGSATVGGFDAETQQRDIHRIIGVCPQVCIKNDAFFNLNVGFCIKNDGFCIQVRQGLAGPDRQAAP